MSGYLIASVEYGAKVAIAIDHITVIAPTRDGKFVRIYTDDHNYTDVTDSFEEVMKGIEVMAR